LAHALGGTVGNNPAGKEFGTVIAHLNDSAADDPLFSDLSANISVHVCHTQTVLSLPPTARVLAFNDMDGCHAFACGKHAWGVQFHPEFDADITRAYIQEHRQELEAEGQDPDQLIKACIDTPIGNRLLRRFAEIVGSIS
jgi:GMP synthase (glutamine-hydrolysing)